ncbi:MAG: universal stress protein [Ferrovibrionaceae bacterium]
MPMISTILVHVDETRHCPARLALAGTLSRRLEADLVGVFVAPPATMPLALPGEVDPGWNDRLSRHRRTIQQQAEEHFAALKQQVPDAVWRVEEADGLGRPGPVLVAQGRRADLIVVGQTETDGALPQGPGLLAQEVMMSAGRPVLIVPQAGRFTDVGRRPLIAWTESREASRALYDALPLLRDAEKVHLLEIGPARAAEEEIARHRDGLATLRRYIEAHGLATASEYLPGVPGIGDASLILSRAADVGADMLVMGGYGHSRLQEMVLGGVTRSILSSMTLPVLISH